MPDALRFQVTFHVPAQATDALDTWLALEALPASLWHDADTPVCRAAIYCASPETAAALRETLPARLQAAGIAAADYSLDDLGDTDWRNAWKRFFHPERISPHILVHPSWEPVTPPPGVQAIELDPGMSFGTGLHGTTRACIRMLDTLHTQGLGGRLLDAGCGSGILTLAALRLGFAPVEAFDLDPRAVADTRDNLTRNGLAATVTAGDALTPPAGPSLDVIVANILAPVLHQALPTLLERLRPGGHILLAGILTSQFDAIRERCTALGLTHLETITLDEWTSGRFQS